MSNSQMITLYNVNKHYNKFLHNKIIFKIKKNFEGYDLWRNNLRQIS